MNWYILEILILGFFIKTTFPWCLYKTYHELAGSQIHEVDWSPNDNYLAIGSKSNRVTVLTIATSNVAWFTNFTNEVQTVKFSKLGKWLAVGLKGNERVYFYNVPNFSSNTSFLSEHGSGVSVNQIDFTNDDKKIVTCGDDSNVIERDTNNLGSRRWRHSMGSGHLVLSCKYASTGKIGGTTYHSSNSKFFFLKSDGTIDQEEPFHYGKEVDFRPATDRYLYSGKVGTVNIYEYETDNNDNINFFISTVNGQIWSVSHSKDKSYLAAGGQNGHFYIINTVDRTKPFIEERFKESGFHINSVKVSKTSNFVAVSRIDGVINIYARVCKQSCPVGYFYNGIGCQLCAISLVGCALCNQQTVCISCYPQYYLNLDVCQLCQYSLMGCQTCKSNIECTSCLSNYYLDSGICKHCSLITTNCQLCFNLTCMKCSYSTYLTSSNICMSCDLSIPYCNKCQQSSVLNSTLECIQCTQGFYVYNGLCFSCPTNCIQCINNSTCIACSQQSQLNGSNCVKCPLNCLSCLENGTCIQCTPSYFLNNGGCSRCSPPCLNCIISPTNCQSCILGYYLSSTNICTRCIGCLICNIFNGTCISCPLGSYLSSPSTCTKCLNTTSHCDLCDNMGCIICQRNYYLSPSKTCIKLANISFCEIYQKNSNVCEHCQLGYFLSSNSSCLKCPPECFQCENFDSCIQCSIGSFLNESIKKCQFCEYPCVTCNQTIDCLSCAEGYYLTGNRCLMCSSSISKCNSCLNSTHCLNCELGSHLSLNSMSCSPCLSPCSTCNLTSCLSCQQGYYYSNGCFRCPQNCSQCQSISLCLKCNHGYSLSTIGSCVFCDNFFPNCKYCSETMCNQCHQYFYLNQSSICQNCLHNISYCLQCNRNQGCLICSPGFYVSIDKSQCKNCSLAIPNCFLCYSQTYCNSCNNGYFLSSLSNCSKCMQGCISCSSISSCQICQLGFYKNSSSLCKQCDQHIVGCQTCTNLNCTRCKYGYFLSSANCNLCNAFLPGCIKCTSNLTCQICDSGYFLSLFNQCQPCSNGCSKCTQSNDCQDCLSGFYKNLFDLCETCKQKYINCRLCNEFTCLKCDVGFHLFNGSCFSCSSYDLSCIFCNQSQCLQCSSGKYLTNGICRTCNIIGCQICSIDGNICQQCQNTYYLNDSICKICSNVDKGCLSCDSINNCQACLTGYYLQSNGRCALCGKKFDGCDICNSYQCISCKSNYFFNQTGGSCRQCKQFMEGCSLCLNQFTCQYCETGYFSQNNRCSSCSIINKCLACMNNNTCFFCQTGYYLKNGICYSCMNSIEGCFSCVSQQVCSVCSGSYSLSSGKCFIRKVSQPRIYDQIKIVSEYVNQNSLKHTLITKKWQFKQIQQEWKTTTKIEIILPLNNRTLLKILRVDWGKLLISFTTNNPFGQIPNNFLYQLPFISGQFYGRRLMLKLDSLNMETYFQMQDNALHQILPDLDTNSQNLVLSYKLDSPQFYRSVIKHNKHYFYLFGISVTILIILIHLIKICFVQKCLDTGSIIPHILLLKAPAIIIYPTLGGYINYCYGFTYIQFPWLNQYFSQNLSSQSDESPYPFQMFYNNLNLASTYLLGIIIFASIFFPLLLYLILKNRKKGDLLNSNWNRGNGICQQLISLLYNIFSIGLISNSLLSIIGIYYNPNQLITLSGFFYILGMLIFIGIFIQSIRQRKKQIRKLRILIKSTIMILLYISPIPLFTILVFVDTIMMILEYQQIFKLWVVPKLWMINHALLLLSYFSLIFLSNMLLGIIISSTAVLGVLAIDVYLQYLEYLQTEKISDMKNENENTKSNFTIQQFVPEQNYKDNLKGIQVTESINFLKGL